MAKVNKLDTWGSLKVLDVIFKRVVEETGSGTDEYSTKVAEIECRCGKRFEVKVWDLAGKQRDREQDCGCGINEQSKAKQERERERDKEPAPTGRARDGKRRSPVCWYVSWQAQNAIQGEAEKRGVSVSRIIEEMIVERFVVGK